MTANERFEKAWNSFLVYLNRNPKAQLTPFLKERHVNHRTMMNWMSEPTLKSKVCLKCLYFTKNNP